ncbi:LPXTG cell wall anchor domain-containing protein [Microbacterium sp. 1.5R]|uniref:LPXTG cell wall anchor domain-containing protein n=1 Tax=Microbacterium sp. 1.5R TaxID=1916917 RepID=UPI0011A875D8|nr:LPXTG cell wall anchor domain-containing protein [Microbacterium sp. 1.5R]
MLKKLAAIGLTAGALVLLAPSMASAADDSDSYANTPRVSVDNPVIESCGASTIAFGAGYYQPSEVLGVSVSGQNAADAAVSGNTAAADGSLVVSFRPPAGAEGTYAITFDRAQDAASYTTRVTVSGGAVAGSSCHHDPVAAGTELALTGNGTELALTGGSVSPWLIGAGAAALIGGGALVATGIVRRRNA